MCVAIFDFHHFFMKTSKILFCSVLVIINFSGATHAQKLPDNIATLNAMASVNTYIKNKWPDVGKRIVNDQSRASNIWTQNKKKEGLMAFYNIAHKPELLDY